MKRHEKEDHTSMGISAGDVEVDWGGFEPPTS